MTFGQKLAKLMTESKLDVYSISEQINVPVEDINSWMDDKLDPDMSSLKALSKLFNCSIDELCSLEDEAPKEEVAPETAPVVEVEQTVVDDKKKAKKENIFKKIVSRDDRKPLIWSIVLGLVAAIATLVICIIKYEDVQLLWTICLPIIIGYVLMADIYCIFTESYVSDVFTTVASWSIHFPGIIFTLDIDGFILLIVIKFIFAVIGAIVGLAVFLLAVALSSLLSVFTFVPLLIYNKTHYDN